MKYLISLFSLLIWMTSCDVSKSITLINHTHRDLTLDIPSLPDTEYFLSHQNDYRFELTAEGEKSKLTMLKGFGKWAKDDPGNLADIMTVSKISFGNTAIQSETVNPDLLKVKRTGLFGHRLKVIFLD